MRIDIILRKILDIKHDFDSINYLVTEINLVNCTHNPLVASFGGVQPPIDNPPAAAVVRSRNSGE